MPLLSTLPDDSALSAFMQWLETSAAPTRSAQKSLDNFSAENSVRPRRITSFKCHYERSAVLPEASCPKVSTEVSVREKRKCPSQPPACCEAARRAEAAAKMIKDTVSGTYIRRKINFRIFKV